MTKQFSATEKHKILAALRLACDRALEEQDVYRRKIAALPKPTLETEAAILDRIIMMPGELLVEFFAGYSFPSTWEDRELFGVRKSWEDDPFNTSKRYRAEIADKDISALIFQLNEWVEHRDRIALEARFQELFGFRLVDIEKLLGKTSLTVQHLNVLRAAVFRYKTLEWLAAQAQELGRIEDEKLFSTLVATMKRLLMAVPQLIADFDRPTTA